MGFSISLSMEERKFEIELVSDGRDTAKSGPQPQLRTLKKAGVKQRTVWHRRHRG
jgi:hypothetical protein